MLRDLNSILEYVDRLNDLNTDDVKPMAQVADYAASEAERSPDDPNRDNRYAYAARDDVQEGLRPSLPHDEAIANAPETDGKFFEVPKVIER